MPTVPPAPASPDTANFRLLALGGAMKRSIFTVLAVTTAALLTGVAMAAPTPTGTISGPNEPGPYTYGDSVTFTTTSSGLRNAHPMIELTCYQDQNGDSEVTVDLFGPDLVWLVLQQPDTSFALGTYFDTSQPAKCQARLLAYGSKGQQQTITQLDAVEFAAVP